MKKILLILVTLILSFVIYDKVNAASQKTVFSPLGGCISKECLAGDGLSFSKNFTIGDYNTWTYTGYNDVLNGYYAEFKFMSPNTGYFQIQVTET